MNKKIQFTKIFTIDDKSQQLFDFDFCSTENFWTYNPEVNKFEDLKRYTQVEHAWGSWVAVKKNFRVFDNCRAIRTYNAVGWGGPDWVCYTHCHHFKENEAFSHLICPCLKNPATAVK